MILPQRRENSNENAILYNVLQNDRSIRAYVDTETARIFFGDNAQDIFGTVLHEDYHWYNALDAEGARTLQEHALEYLAKSSGYESLDEMIRAKLRDYSAQSLTYEQAAEELVADAWRGMSARASSPRRISRRSAGRSIEWRDKDVDS